MGPDYVRKLRELAKLLAEGRRAIKQAVRDGVTAKRALRFHIELEDRLAAAAELGFTDIYRHPASADCSLPIGDAAAVKKKLAPWADAFGEYEALLLDEARRADCEAINDSQGRGELGQLSGPADNSDLAKPAPELRNAGQRGDPKKHVASTKKTKRGTERGEARTKIIAVLIKHHEYENGSCMNSDPIDNNELARLAGVGKSTASDFFKKEFGGPERKDGHTKYKIVCRNAGRLADSLKVLTDEFSPHDLYGRYPPGEYERDD